jgi:hypothetical protein
MPIHGQKIPLDLASATPTALTPENLQAQLNDIGLTCKYTSRYNLSAFIGEVKSQIPDTPEATQVWGIVNPAAALAAPEGYERAMAAALSAGDAPTGNWTPNPQALGYATYLHYVVAHYDWLKANRPTFTGQREANNYSQAYDSVESIKSAFVNLATNMASVVASGLNRAAIEATFSDIISPMTDSQAKDYDKTDSRVLMLVDDYDPTADTANGIGVLMVEWRLVIKDYKKKKEAMKYNTTLDITATAVEYGAVAPLMADYNAALAHFKTTLDAAAVALTGNGTIPPRDTKLTIFAQLPSADQDTFQRSLPLVATAQESEVIVLYAPELDNIGSIDNSNSDASTSFSKSMTSGFSFSSTQSLKIGAEFEAGALFAKAKFTMEFTLSFSQTSSRSSTETIAFDVPAGKKCFTYQGTLNAAVLTFDAQEGTFTYTNAGRFQTPILATSRTPLLNANIAPPSG